MPRVCCSAPYRMAVEPSDPSGSGGGSSGSSGSGAPRTLRLGQPLLYCSCGHSRRDPFCDSSCDAPELQHLRSAHPPLPFVCNKQQTFVLLCGCKRTKCPPYCDGAHSKLTRNDMAW